MRLLILLPAILLPAASAAAPPVISSEPNRQAAADMRIFNPNFRADSSCPPTSRYQAMQKDGGVNAQKLNELPPADHYKAAYRRVGQCELPIVVGYGIGAGR